MRDFAESLVRPLNFGRTAPFWSWLAPLAAWIAYGLLHSRALDPTVAIFLAALLMPAVLAAVHHAEVIAVKVGEPFGTLVLALAVTVIECALIVTLMLAKPDTSAALLRDTVYSAVMIILGGVVGICIAVGAARHHVQRFGLYGVSAASTTLAALAVLVLVLPNFTTSTSGPTFTEGQLLLVGAASLVLWLLFVFIQTVSHRDYFLPDDADAGTYHGSESCTNRQAALALALLIASLVAVVLLAKSLSDPLASAIVKTGAPLSAVGVVIAGVVLLPEGLAALRAARANRLQTSLNLALGSALATIGLTVPIIATLSVIFDWTLVLGLDAKGVTLLALMILVSSMSLSTGRTTVLQGAVHLVIFVFFLFTSFMP
jgi:Ca2+:H+ antiporter